jgi:hypothetical protein
MCIDRTVCVYLCLLYQGNCGAYTTKQTCLEQTYTYDSSRSMCRWEEDKRSQACVYIEADSDNYVATIILAVVSNMVTLPINMLITYIFDRYVMPPVMSRELYQAKIEERRTSPRSHMS